MAQSSNIELNVHEKSKLQSLISLHLERREFDEAFDQIKPFPAQFNIFLKPLADYLPLTEIRSLLETKFNLLKPFILQAKLEKLKSDFPFEVEEKLKNYDPNLLSLYLKNYSYTAYGDQNPLIKYDTYGPTEIILKKCEKEIEKICKYGFINEKKKKIFHPSKYLKVCHLSPDYKSEVIDHKNFESCLHQIRTHIFEFKIIGVDSMKNFSLSGIEDRYLAIIQLATKEKCFIFQTKYLRKNVQFSQFIKEILETPNIKKIGHRANEELKLLTETLNLDAHINLRNYADIAELYRELYKIRECDKDKVQMKKIYASILGNELNKVLSVFEMQSNWSSDKLRLTQIHFASLNSLLMIHLYQKLIEDSEYNHNSLLSTENQILEPVKSISISDDSPREANSVASTNTGSPHTSVIELEGTSSMYEPKIQESENEEEDRHKFWRIVAPTCSVIKSSENSYIDPIGVGNRESVGSYKNWWDCEGSFITELQRVFNCIELIQ